MAPSTRPTEGLKLLEEFSVGEESTNMVDSGPDEHGYIDYMITTRLLFRGDHFII